MINAVEIGLISFMYSEKSFMMNAIGIISFGDEVSLPGCLDKKSDMYISLPFKYLMLKLY